MTTPYKELTTDLSKYLGMIRKEAPDMMKGFSDMAQAASAEGALDKKTKELLAIALSVAAHCKPCIGFHMQKLIGLGTTRAELIETLGMAIFMGGGPSLMYAAETLKAFEELGGCTQKEI